MTRLAAITAAVALLGQPGAAVSAQGAVWPPPSARLLVNGTPWCHATPMTDGWYSAAHCADRRAVLAVEGLGALPWSMDPARDLMHLAGPGLPGVALRTPVRGEPVVWASERGTGRYGVARVDCDAAGCVAMLCHTAGGRLRYGDSGTGLWAEADGALVAIFTLFEPEPSGVRCPPGRYAVWGVVVP